MLPLKNYDQESKRLISHCGGLKSLLFERYSLTPFTCNPSLPQRANTTVFNVPLSNLSASIFNEKGVNITRRRSAKAFEDKKRHVSTHAETNVLKLKL